MPLTSMTQPSRAQRATHDPKRIEALHRETPSKGLFEDGLK